MKGATDGQTRIRLTLVFRGKVITASHRGILPNKAAYKALNWHELPESLRER
jgi:hypothetical protein